MKTLFELLHESPGKVRTELLMRIEQEINRVFCSHGCVISIITNVFSPVALPIGAMLDVHAMQIIEQALIKFRSDGCDDLYVVLSTLGGEIHFPEMFMRKTRGLGFRRVSVVIPSIAMSAGTLLAMLADRVIGLSSASIGPIDPQLIVQTPHGPRVVSAIAYKQLIEETLPRLAMQKNLGADGLAWLYVAQDMYLYQESLRSLDYVKHVLDTYVRPRLSEEKYEELVKRFLTEVETHSKPLNLLLLRDLGFDVVLLDEDSRYETLLELISEYYSRVEKAFLFEPSRGIKVLLIGTKYGEMMQEAVIQAIPLAPSVQPPSKQGVQKARERGQSTGGDNVIEHVLSAETP